MATKLYLTNTTRPDDSPLGLVTDPAFWDGTSKGYAYGARKLSTSKGSADTGGGGTTVAGPVSGIVLASGGVAVPAWVTDPIAAAFTLSGTVNINIWASENSVNANAELTVRLYKLSSAGVLTAIITDSKKGAELPLGAAVVQNWNASPSSTDLDKGDRLVFFVGADDAPAVTMGAGFAVAIRYGGTTDAAQGDTWIQLTENPTFDSSTPAGDIYYLRDDASTVDMGAGNDERALSKTIGSSSATGVINLPTGPVALASARWTKTAGGDTMEWYSPRLLGSLSGPVLAHVWFTQSDTSNVCVTAELAVVDSDGSNPVVYGRGDLLSFGEQWNVPFSGTRGNMRVYLEGPTATLVGRRLRFRLYVDDDYYRGGGALPGSDSATVYYNGATDSGDGNKSYIQLSDSLAYVFLSGVEKRIVGPLQLSATANTVLYTAPAEGAAWIRHIYVSNPTGSTRALWLAVGPAPVGHFDDHPIAPGEIIDQRRAADHWLNGGEEIQGWADVGSACVIVIDAIEYTV